jgi:16S rRNA (guanine527-N7)-methyltransferase
MNKSAIEKARNFAGVALECLSNPWIDHDNQFENECLSERESDDMQRYSANMTSSNMTSIDEQFEPQTDELSATLAAVGIDVTADQTDHLDHYRRLLWSWNEKINLTRHTTLEKFVHRDVFDSWQLSKLLQPGERVLDVGTGGGVPGVVLAILRPDLAMSVCESTAKKARAVDSIVGEMDLPASVFGCRAEEALEASTFDTLVARAVAPLRKILTWLGPHWEAFDQLLIIKGPGWVEERAEARHHGVMRGLALRKASVYQTPLTGAESVILRILPEGRRGHAGDTED